MAWELYSASVLRIASFGHAPDASAGLPMSTSPLPVAAANARTIVAMAGLTLSRRRRGVETPFGRGSWPSADITRRGVPNRGGAALKSGCAEGRTAALRAGLRARRDSWAR